MAESTGKRKSEPYSRPGKVRVKISSQMFKVDDVSHDDMVKNLGLAVAYASDKTPTYLPNVSPDNCVFLEDKKLYAFVRTVPDRAARFNTLLNIRTIANCLLVKHEDYLEGAADGVFIPMHIRTLYYILKSSCQHTDRAPITSIKVVRNLVDTLCCLFQCTRSSLGVMSDESKSLFFGNLIVTRRGFGSSTHTHDISLWSQPQSTSKYNIIKVIKPSVNPPRFILVVEKKSCFSQLLAANFHSTHPCVVITGSGYASCECREFVNFIQEKLELRVFMFVDFNPHGFEIFSTFKYGSQKLCFMSGNLVTPSIELIGLFISDFEPRFMDGMMKFNPTDLKKYELLVSLHWLGFESNLAKSFTFFEENHMKADMEHFMYHSNDSSYIANQLLPDKLRTLHLMEEPGRHESGVSNAMFDNVHVPRSMRGFFEYYPYIAGDGHCGYRCVAFTLYNDQEKWADVRRDLLKELKSHEVMLGPTYKEQREKLNHFATTGLPFYYLEIDALGLVIATVYQRVVVCLNGEGSMTFLPLRLTKDDLSSITSAPKIAMLLEGQHFSALTLDDEAPLPPLHPLWKSHSNVEVKPLEEHYGEYFQKFLPHAS